jgi:hypothetical protein
MRNLQRRSPLRFPRINERESSRKDWDLSRLSDLWNIAQRLVMR